MPPPGGGFLFADELIADLMDTRHNTATDDAMMLPTLTAKLVIRELVVTRRTNYSMACRHHQFVGTTTASPGERARWAHRSYTVKPRAV